MRKIALRFIIAATTFTAGVTGTVVYYVIPLVEREARITREIALQDNLRNLRKAINRYADSTGELPRTLNDLVEAQMIPSIPFDPFVEKREWKVMMGDELNGSRVKSGIIDVRSTSSEKSLDNTSYSEW